MQTERTILTTLNKSDYANILVMYAEPDTFKYIPALQNKTEQEYIEFLNSRIEQVKAGTGYHWCVRARANGEFIGLMNLNPISGTSKMQVGFQLKQKFWKQGYATELTASVLNFALHKAKLKNVYGVFSSDNVASKKIFEKFGFAFEQGKMYESETSLVEIWKYSADN